MDDNTSASRLPTIAPLLPGIPGLSWTEIRAAAVELAGHGWPVLPGTYQLVEHGSWLGKAGAGGLEPAAALWQQAATTNPGVALDWWTRRPYSVLLACGIAVSAVEAPATHGECALPQLSPSERGPVAVTPFGSWLFFVRSDGAPLRPELAANAHAHLHAVGTWLPLPPTAQEGLPYRWAVPPSAVSWVLPTSTDVQQALVASLSCPASGSRPTT